MVDERVSRAWRSASPCIGLNLLADGLNEVVNPRAVARRHRVAGMTNGRRDACRRFAG